MVCKDKNKISFFFGAGCEGKGNFEISSGFEYLKSSLFSSGFEDDLKKYFKEKTYFNDNVTYSKHKLDSKKAILNNLVLQKAINDREFFENFKGIICKLLTEEKLKHLSDEYKLTDELIHIKQNKDKDESKGTDKIEKEFNSIISKNEKYSKIKNPILMKLFSEDKKGNITYDTNIGMAGVLDAYFHTIIDPYKYGNVKFSKIFNYYWACYFTILRDILDFLVSNNQNQFEKYLISKDNLNVEDKKLNYSDVLKDLHDLTRELYDLDFSKIAPENCYYKLIKKQLDKYEKTLDCNCVITTNYYRFCEIVSENAIYLNGRLNYFEYPELLEVTDIVKDELKKDKMFFPFIFGQSLVKPIINSKQICEFQKLADNLEKTDILVVFGFGINEDDNHINAFLHEYAEQGKTMIIVTDEEKTNYKNKLKCQDKANIHICKVKYVNNENVVNSIFEIIKNLEKGGDINEIQKAEKNQNLV